MASVFYTEQNRTGFTETYNDGIISVTLSQDAKISVEEIQCHISCLGYYLFCVEVHAIGMTYYLLYIQDVKETLAVCTLSDLLKPL